MTMELVEVKEELKKFFKSRKESLHNFEKWAMEMIYACTYYDTLGIKPYDPKEVIDNCVWNGRELYNVKYQIFPDRGKQSRMWITDRGVLVLELIDESPEVPNELYYFL